MKKSSFSIIFFTFSFLAFFSVTFLFPVFPAFAQGGDLLSPEETLWLKSRNNTIIVYPKENAPPYSYKNSAGNPQGLAIDYLELIAEKIGVKIEYLTPRSNSQVLSDIKSGKGDVVTAVSPDVEKEEYLIFTTNYLTSPAVIVVRKDSDKKSGLNLNDFNGKRVAVVDGSALEGYVRINYPRVVVEQVTDDEVGLQQVVLGEVEATVMDVASLSFFLSKQVLTSVKIAGNTGFEYKASFGISKNTPILQSILEKGLSQISTSDRNILIEKWLQLPGENKKDDNFLASIIGRDLELGVFYVLLGVAVLVTLVTLMRGGSPLRRRHLRKISDTRELREEFSELEEESTLLSHELEDIKSEEERLKEKIKSLS